MNRRILVAAVALAGVGLLVRGSAAAFTAAVSVGGNSFTVDSVRAHVSVAPGALATGGVDDLAIALGFVSSPRSFPAAFTVTNVGAAAETLALSLSGVPQVDSAVFAASGTGSVTLAPGASSDVTLTTSPTVAGAGRGTLRLTVGSLPWLYRDYALSVDAAPVAPAALTAAARAAGVVSLSWPASATTNVAGYDVYRSTGGGAFAKLNAAPLAGVAYDDSATVDGGTYAYVVRAVSAGSPAFSSDPSTQAQATADATPPSAPTASYVDNKNAPDQITGSTESGATVVASQTAPSASGPYTATASATGSYLVTVAAASRRTTVTYSVTARDAAGNTSSAVTLTAVANR